MKELWTSKICRETHISSSNIFLDQLKRDDISLEEKEYLIKTLKEMNDKELDFEKKDSDFQNKIGFSKGMATGAAYMACAYGIGLILGKLIKK